jgi:two-component system response regulator FixJ
MRIVVDRDVVDINQSDGPSQLANGHVRSLTPGCLVSDVRMPGMDGMELLRVLAERDADLPVVMLTAHGDVTMAVNAMKTGAVEFLEKPCHANHLRQKVGEALARNATNQSKLDEREEIRQLLSNLTPREREVLDLLVDGKQARTVSKRLGSSHNTVRVQRTTIMKKMRADNLADLINMLHRGDGSGMS